MIISSVINGKRTSKMSDTCNIHEITKTKFGGLKCGGLSSPMEKDEHIDGVIKDAKALIEEKTGLKLSSIDVHSYKKQVVSGMNYFVKATLKTEDGIEKMAHLRIYKDIQSKIELTAFQMDKAASDAIEYFQ